MRWFEVVRRSQSAEVYTMSESEVLVEEEEQVVEDVRPIKGIGTLVFGKWDASAITCKDPGFSPTSTSQPLAYLILEVDMRTLGLEKRSCLLSNATSTNSCEPVLTPVRSKAQ